jgi:hypothetical protein
MHFWIVHEGNLRSFREMRKKSESSGNTYDNDYTGTFVDLLLAVGGVLFESLEA